MACGTGKVLFQDNFAKLQRSWPFTLGDNASVGADGFKIKLNPNGFFETLNQAGLYDNYEVCMTATLEYESGSGSYFGVAFWGVDDKNYYSLDVSPPYGTYSVWRLQNNRSLKPIPWSDTKALVKDSGKPNEISVVVKGNHAEISINGQKIDELDGVAPDGGSVIGFEFGAAKADKAPTTMILKSIEVREVQ
jgi:hypothetical protein